VEPEFRYHLTNQDRQLWSLISCGGLKLGATIMKPESWDHPASRDPESLDAQQVSDHSMRWAESDSTIVGS